MITLKNKKGSEMTIGTIIVIILALVVLVFLIFGFSAGWGNLWDKLKNLGGTSSNVDNIVLACRTACDTNSQNDYNNVPREVKINATLKFTATCAQLESPIRRCYAGSKEIAIAEDKCEVPLGSYEEKGCWNSTNDFVGTGAVQTDCDKLVTLPDKATLKAGCKGKDNKLVPGVSQAACGAPGTLRPVSQAIITEPCGKW